MVRKVLERDTFYCYEDSLEGGDGDLREEGYRNFVREIRGLKEYGEQ